MQYELPGGKSLLRGGTRVKKPVRSLVSRPTPTVQRFVGRPTPKMSLSKKSKKSKNSSNNALPPAVKAILKGMPEVLELIPYLVVNYMFRVHLMYTQLNWLYSKQQHI